MLNCYVISAVLYGSEGFTVKEENGVNGDVVLQKEAENTKGVFKKKETKRNVHLESGKKRVEISTALID